MKSNYKSKMFVSYSDIKKEVDREHEAHIDEMYETVKRDVVAQIMAVCCMELKNEFGFGCERLKRFYSGVNGLFKIMATDGLMGKPFTPVNCIELLRDKYGIDLDKHA